jgi:metal transporter CNNM
MDTLSALQDVIKTALKSRKDREDPIDASELAVFMGIIVTLVLLGGIVAGLTIGLMSLDETNLTLLMRSGTAVQKKHAAKIIPIRKNTHLLLVTLLLTNTMINETLPVLFHWIKLDGWQAVLASTALILLFGE